MIETDLQDVEARHINTTKHGSRSGLDPLNQPLGLNVYKSKAVREEFKEREVSASGISLRNGTSLVLKWGIVEENSLIIQCCYMLLKGFGIVSLWVCVHMHFCIYIFMYVLEGGSTRNKKITPLYAL